MQRRNFLIGVGGTALGSSALVGSGAFTTGTLEDREANIEVAHDQYGSITLLDMMWNSDVTGYTDDGRYYIDFAAGSSEGANVGGDFQLGVLPEDLETSEHLGYDDPDANSELWHEFVGEYPQFEDDTGLGWWAPSAFALMNRGTQTYDLTVEYEADDPGGSVLEIYAFNGAWDSFDYGDPDGSPVVSVNGNNPDSWTLESSFTPEDKRFTPGKRIFFTVRVDTLDDSATPADDLSGTLTITAS